MSLLIHLLCNAPRRFRAEVILIVTFLAFEAANIFHGYAVHLTGFEIVMEFLVNAVEFIAAGAVIVIEVDFGFAVTVHAPTHT
jgi:archaellum biogenesis ATPase FlaH